MAQKLIDETGNKYGSLTVLYKTKDKNNRTAWMCKCDCGNTKIARGSDLRSGRITTCGKGCPYKAERSKIYKDETGNRYGKLVVLYRNGTNSSNKPVWHCKCDCGNETDVVGGDLRSGRTMSCGCLKSANEEKIQKILNEMNLSFKREYSFSDLCGIGNKPLRFDFAVFENDKIKFLIEFQGDQHFYPVKAFGGIDSYNIRKEHDKRKLEYCKDNNIKLLILTKSSNLYTEIYKWNLGLGGINV